MGKLEITNWHLKCRLRRTSQSALCFHRTRRDQAVQMSVFVVRAFLKMRALLGYKGDLAQKLASLEKELTKRLDVQEAVIVTILQRFMDIIDPPMIQQTPKPQIGFNP
jgi:hypothetical protein